MAMTRQEHMLQFELISGSDYGAFILNILGRLPFNINKILCF